jgi:transketolase
MGIAEADMMGTAAGLAATGKTAFASTFAVFATGRAFDQVRQSIAVPGLNVKICATHAGLTVGEDGGSHQSVEDIALMRVLPNMTVIVPSDAAQTRWAVRVAAEKNGPFYVRLGRAAVPEIYDEEAEFELGKAKVSSRGTGCHHNRMRSHGIAGAGGRRCARSERNPCARAGHAHHKALGR